MGVVIMIILTVATYNGRPSVAQTATETTLKACEATRAALTATTSPVGTGLQVVYKVHCMQKF